LQVHLPGTITGPSAYSNVDVVAQTEAGYTVAIVLKWPFRISSTTRPKASMSGYPNPGERDEGMTWTPRSPYGAHVADEVLTSRWPGMMI
jgi:hypothetical protein